MKYYNIFLQLILQVLCNNVFGDIKLLEKSLHTPVFDIWSFKTNFTNFQKLKMDQSSVNIALRKEGHITNKYLERVFDKAVHGENVTMLVLGGSSSKGADLGCNNTQCTFHYSISTWWNTIIYPSTGSYMKREVIAVGGCGTTYFAHCWHEYLSKNEVIDIILWEFFLNDPDYTPYGAGVEKFVRSIYTYPTQPVLIFNKFFTKGHFPNKNGITNLKEKSGQMKTQVLDLLSNHYGFTIIDLLPAVKNYVLYKSVNNDLNPNNMFIEKHPSHLAHAQLAYLVIEYIRKKFFTHLNSVQFKNYKRSENSHIWTYYRHHNKNVFNNTNFGIHHNTYYTRLKTLNNKTLQRRQKIDQITVKANGEIELPTAIYDILDESSLCWTTVMPDDRFIMPHNLLKLKVLWNYGFAVYRTPPWNKALALRRDIRGGYIASFPGQHLQLSFTISNAGYLKNIYVAISHEPLGGLSIFIVKDSTNKSLQKTIDCSRNTPSAMSIIFMGEIAPGNAELIIQTISGGCHLSSIIIE